MRFSSQRKRFNLKPSQWGPALSLFTTVFATGQIVGPVAAGAAADWAGGTELGLAGAAVILFAGAAIAVAQQPTE